MEDNWSEADAYIMCEAAERAEKEYLSFKRESPHDSEVLPVESSLLRKTIVKLGHDLTEYLTIGIDPVSFKPMVRICNTVGTVMTHVSCSLYHYNCFRSYLELRFSRLSGPSYHGEIFVDSRTKTTYNLKSVFGEEVTISIKAVKQIVRYCKEFENLSEKYADDYRRSKDAIEKHQMQTYRKHFAENFNEVKKCHVLSKYFGMKSEN